MISSVAESTTLATEACVAATRLPFTESELRVLRDDMPLTSGLASLASSLLGNHAGPGERPFEGFGGIFTIHHQTDFVVLIETAIELGMSPDDITVIDKEYAYRYSDRVDEHLKSRLGLRVFKYTDLRIALADHLRRMVPDVDGPWKQTVVLDDGGYIFRTIVENIEIFRNWLQFFVGLVEQTTSGISSIRRFFPTLQQEKFPLFSVAESQLKAMVESHGIARAAVQSLRNIIPNVKFEGRRALVIGHGKIGTAMAEILRENRFITTVFDKSIAKRIYAREKGHRTGHDIREILSTFSPHFIFGCAGSWASSGEPIPSVTADELAELSNDAYLVSLTSRDYEFDISGLESSAVEIESHTAVGRSFRITESEREITVVLVAGGYPVNFHNAESMPNQHSDLIMASMLTGGIAVCSSPRRYDIQRRGVGEEDNGAVAEEEDMTLSASGLLERYFKLYQ